MNLKYMQEQMFEEPVEEQNEDERFILLVSRHQLPLTAFLRTLLNSQADVEDVLQETNLVLWRKRDEYDYERSFAPWACRIAQLQVLSLLKSRGKKPHISLNEDVLEEIAKSAIEQLDQWDRKAEELQRCVEKLPAHQQKMLKKRYQHSLSVQEVAAQQGRSPQAVAMMYYRLRHLLKECIERALRAEEVPG